MNSTDLARAAWTISSYSAPNQQACVEVTGDLPRIAIRDSTRRNVGFCTASRSAWAAFAHAAAGDRLVSRATST